MISSLRRSGEMLDLLVLARLVPLLLSLLDQLEARQYNWLSSSRLGEGQA